MIKTSLFLGGLVMGVGAMFFLDPARGRKRRAQVRYRVGDLSKLARRVITRTRKTLRSGSEDLTRTVAAKLRSVPLAMAH